VPTVPVRATLFVHLSGRNGEDKVGVSNDQDGTEGAADLGDSIPGSGADRLSRPVSDAPTEAGLAPDGQERAVGGSTPVRLPGSTPIRAGGSSTPIRVGGSSPFRPDDTVDPPDVVGDEFGADDLSAEDVPAGDLRVDEVDADAESDEAEGSLAPVGAAAGSARAAARRSAVRTGVTEKKGRATVGRDDSAGGGLNVFARISRYLREVVAELRKVIWPSRNQMVTYTIVVIVFVVFMVALVYGLDLLFAKGVLAIFG